VERPRLTVEGDKGTDKAAWYFIAAMSVLLVWIGLSVYFVLPANVLSSESKSYKDVRMAFNTVSPQGWGFFTNPPQSDEIAAYDATSHDSLLMTPQGRVENMFGISRTQRAQGPELALLTNAVTTWTECNLGSSREECLADASSLSPQSVSVDVVHQTLCGPVLLTTESFTAFEYREFDLPEHSITTYAHVEVKC
jgi:antimicrobial peptide system SdpA family protein